MPTGTPIQLTQLQQDAIDAALSARWPKRRIAAYIGIPESTLRGYLQRRPVTFPENPEEAVEIVMPIQLTPSSEPTMIWPGDAAYCVVSHKTGIDDDPRLQPPRKRAKPAKEAAKFVPKGKGRKTA